MDHITLLAELYKAYKDDDWAYAQQLQIAYPEVAKDTIAMIMQAETHADFLAQLEEKTKY